MCLLGFLFLDRDKEGKSQVQRHYEHCCSVRGCRFSYTLERNAPFLLLVTTLSSAGFGQQFSIPSGTSKGLWLSQNKPSCSHILIKPELGRNLLGLDRQGYKMSLCPHPTGHPCYCLACWQAGWPTDE